MKKMRGWTKLNYIDFNKEINSGVLKNIYLLTGKEEYLIDEGLKRLKEKHINPSLEALNYTILEGGSIDFEDILNASETLPFMSEKRIVIVRDSIIFSGNGNNDNRIKAMRKELLEYLDNINESTVLILIEKKESIRKNNAIYKKIDSLSGIVDMEKLKGFQLENWIQVQFKNRGKTINKSEINYFIQQTSYLDKNKEKTLYDLKNEIDKIINYMEELNTVEKTHIDGLILKPLDINVFNLLGFISKKNGKESIRVFNEMYLGGEATLFILHMIARQFRNMLNIKILKRQGYSDGLIIEKSKISQFEYSKLNRELNNFSEEQLDKFLLYSQETDKNIKTGKYQDKLALEILLTKLCYYK